MAKISLFSGPTATLLLACCTSAAPTYAGLSRLPSSHTEPTPNGRHVLVFLAPVQPIEEGSVTEEERNRTVLLNNKYPASGCYEIGSTTPLWTAPWDGHDGWAVSDDCRYLVRWNRFGDGQYGRGGELSWGIKFYDQGREIKNYDVAELVDYPALMPYTTWDWHFDWVGDGEDNCTIHDGQFIFQTSTHESYRFNLATGAIVEQSRVWRTLTRAGITLLIAAVVGACLLLVRSRKNEVIVHSTGKQSVETHQQQSPHPPRRFSSYSLRALLKFTTLTALVCLVVPRWPQLAILLAVLLTAVFLTRATFQYRRATRNSPDSGRRRDGLTWRVLATGLVWSCFYVLSAAPALSLMDWLRTPDDVRTAVILTVYRPLVWISASYGESPPVDWYFRAWGIH